MSEPQVRVLKQLGKAVLLMATSAIAVPYTLAVLANTLYGWPQGKDRYKRALNPRKVYAMNYAILQQLGNLRYARLYFCWKQFYSSAGPQRLIKDIAYGENNNTLDVYFPENSTGVHPALVYVYGGAWGSGHKEMYGLLCSNLADMLKTVVVCPNYSLYPKGYVDDMVQDVVHVLTWIHQHGHEYNMDKERILLVGHSAGAHLVSMATLELVMKRLLTNPESVISTTPAVEYSRQSSVFAESIRFDEGHFNGSNNTSRQISETGEQTIDSSIVKSQETLEESIPDSSERIAETEEVQLNLDESREGMEEGRKEAEGLEPESASTTGSFYFVDKSQSKVGSESYMVLDEDKEEGEKGERDGGGEEEEGEAKDVEEEKTEEQEEDDEPRIDLSALESSEIQEEAPEVDLTQSQREVRDILSSIKAVIGLAGVYHIGDHYEHESWRGVEDISSMGKAMYGQDFFDRFSPSHIIPNLPQNTRFPPVHLVHGDVDTTVPTSSSTKFGQALWELGCRQIQVSILPGCGHSDICVDLMDSTRTWHDPVMAAILETANRFL